MNHNRQHCFMGPQFPSWSNVGQQLQDMAHQVQDWKLYFHVEVIYNHISMTADV